MPLPKPSLDPGSFDQLVSECRGAADAQCARLDRPQRVGPRHHAARARRLAGRTEPLSPRPPVGRSAAGLRAAGRHRAPACRAWRRRSWRSEPGRHGDRSAGAAAARQLRRRALRDDGRARRVAGAARWVSGQGTRTPWTPLDAGIGSDAFLAFGAQPRPGRALHPGIRSRAGPPGRHADLCMPGPTTGRTTPRYGRRCRPRRRHWRRTAARATASAGLASPLPCSHGVGVHLAAAGVWRPLADVADETRALTLSGFVRFTAPADPGPRGSAAATGCAAASSAAASSARRDWRGLAFNAVACEHALSRARAQPRHFAWPCGCRLRRRRGAGRRRQHAAEPEGPCRSASRTTGAKSPTGTGPGARPRLSGSTRSAARSTAATACVARSCRPGNELGARYRARRRGRGNVGRAP